MRSAAPCLWLLVACSPSNGPNTTTPYTDPIDGLSDADLATFDMGAQLFTQKWADADGLGPLFIVTSCGGCHTNTARGPGTVQKMAVVEADGYTTSPNQRALFWGDSVRLGLTAGATTPIVPPGGIADDPSNWQTFAMCTSAVDPERCALHGGQRLVSYRSIKVSTRLGPQVLGRGYLEAIDDAEIVAQQASQALRTDGIHGVTNRVIFASVPNPDTSFSNYQTGQTNIIGRFGLKARQPVIDDYIANAYQGAIGLTSPMRPTEDINPDGIVDDDKTGVDIDLLTLDNVAFYVRRIAIPPRFDLSDQGAQLFDQARCSACHVPTMHTRADYPIKELANIDAPVFTDMLLHDMGPALADGCSDGTSFSTAWRTPPLIGVRFAGGKFMSDGRADSVHAAILLHAGEAAGALNAFLALSKDDQETLIAYVDAL